MPLIINRNTNYTITRGSSVVLSKGLLLDFFRNASAAYSLRRLRVAYNGPAIRVRRSNDNSEQDIGFTYDDVLNTDQLSSFVGSNSGFVTKWYDQNGGVTPRDLVQATAANQPRIVLSGSIDTENGLPCIIFDGVASAFTEVQSFVVGTPRTILSLQKSRKSTGTQNIFRVGTTAPFIHRFDTTNFRTYGGSPAGSFDAQTAVTTTFRLLLTSIYEDTAAYQYINGISGSSDLTGAVGGDITAAYQVGWTSGFSEYFSGSMQELVVYNIVQSANRTGIETNINNYYQLYWGGATPALLDNYPGASAAYSLRNLSSTYRGPLIRVRRSSDNVEADIRGTYSGNLDTGSLLEFVGSASGFITTWYDQSGNSWNATQTTAVNQPRIVLSGSIDTQLSKPTIQFFNQSGNGFTTSLPVNNPFSIIGVVSQDTGSSAINNRIFQSSTNNSLITIKRTDNISIYTGTTVLANFPSQISNRPYIISFLRQSTSNFAYQNNLPVTISSTDSSNWGTFTMAAIGTFATEAIVGKISEVVIYPTNQNSNISGIHNNINSYYQLYSFWTGGTTGLLDTYTNAAAAYSLRNLSSTYVGPLIRVRRSSDNTELDIYGNSIGNLDTGSLLIFVGSSNGFVTTWYDQSGNGRNITQTTAASQPQIINAGSIRLFKTVPSLYFSGNALTNNNFTLSQPNTYFLITQGTSTNATGDRNMFDGTSSLSRNAIGKSNVNSNYFMYAGTLTYSSTLVDTSSSLFTAVFNTTTSNLYRNSTNILANANPGSQGLGGIILGGFTTAQALWEGFIPEFIIYNTDQTSNRTGIESNINSYYSIY